MISVQITRTEAYTLSVCGDLVAIVGGERPCFVSADWAPSFLPSEIVCLATQMLRARKGTDL